MALSFPNPSRSFDDTNNRIQFWGYDRALEVTFFVEADALKKLRPGLNDAEAGLLKAFDDALRGIHEAANRMYTRDRQHRFAYTLAAEDF